MARVVEDVTVIAGLQRCQFVKLILIGLPECKRSLLMQLLGVVHFEALPS